MFRSFLDIDESQTVTGIDVYTRHHWSIAVVLLVVAVALVIWLYRSERQLSRTRLIVMGVSQALAWVVLIILLMEPIADVRLRDPYNRTILVLLDTSRSMATKDPLGSADEVAEAAAALGKIPLGESLDGARIAQVRDQIGPVSRIDLARAAMQHPEIKLFDKLSETYNVRFFSFDSRIKPEGGAEDPSAWLDSREADGDASRVGSAIDEAVARYTGQPIAGVVVLSDFAWADGKDPASVATKLNGRSIPVFPVTIGLPQPPDIQLRPVIAPEVVFKGDKVPLRVQIDSRGFEGRNVELVLRVDGQHSTSQQVELKEGVQYEEMMFTPDDTSGSVQLEVSIDALAGEISDKNNKQPHKVRVIDEKIKVLYVEGMPRWEYRYLRWVLLRDPRLQVTFLMTQGDPALAATSPRHISRFPQVAKDAFKYDLIILGDVPSSYFTTPQLDMIADLIAEKGSSLLMVAGQLAAPTSYRDTPIAKVLPVNIGGQWKGVGGQVYPVVTAEGAASDVASLSLDPQINERIWSRVRPMYALPDVTPKKGATVLLSLPKEIEEIRDYPLVAWQPYRTGKSMFVGTEDLWRMRLEVGDRYHARFWGQAIQFLALSRLLGQNKQIAIRTSRGNYAVGQPISVSATVLDDSFNPVDQKDYPVVIERKGVPGSAAVIELPKVVDSPGTYAGVRLADETGTWVIRTTAPDADVSNRVEIEVKKVELEDRETAMQPGVARELAELSGGKVVKLTDLGSLPEKLGVQEQLATTIRMEKTLWDQPVLYVLLVVFCGIEWYLRRRDNLV